MNTNLEKTEYCECERCGRLVICSKYNGEMLCSRCKTDAKANEV